MNAVSRIRRAFRGWVGLALGLFALAPAEPWADVPIPPEQNVRVLSSPGCAMRALSRAVDRRSSSITDCTNGEAPGSRRARFGCTFDTAGIVVSCQALPNPKPTLSKGTLTCIEGALSAIKLNPKDGDPAQCQAQIEVSYSRRPRRRPDRYLPDPNNPLHGI